MAETKPTVPSPSWKKPVTLVLKLGLGFGAVAWVLRSRLIDFERLGSVLADPKNGVVVLLALTTSMLLCAIRWSFLARAQGLSLPFPLAIELTMIGNFFNTFLPGSVGGDLIKAWYAAGCEPERKGRAVFAVLLDRAVGLSMFLLYSTVAMAAMGSVAARRPELVTLGTALFSVTATLVVGAVAVFSPSGDWLKLDLIEKRLERFPLLRKAFYTVILYRHRRGTVLLALALTALSILCQTLLFYWLGRRFGVPFPLATYFFFVPVALTVTAIPLLPGGIGVGQVAFVSLFSWLGATGPEGAQVGATLCTAAQCYTIAFNCVGAVFYARFRRLPAVATTEAADEAPAVAQKALR
jgi:uncharacterized protein (TIRG00374 family)